MEKDLAYYSTLPRDQLNDLMNYHSRLETCGIVTLMHQSRSAGESSHAD